METATRLDDLQVVRALRERDEAAFAMLVREEHIARAETLTPEAEQALLDAFRTWRQS